MGRPIILPREKPVSFLLGSLYRHYWRTIESFLRPLSVPPPQLLGFWKERRYALSAQQYFPSPLVGEGVTVVKMSLRSPLAGSRFDWHVPVTVGHGSHLDAGCRGGNVKRSQKAKQTRCDSLSRRHSEHFEARATGVIRSQAVTGV